MSKTVTSLFKYTVVDEYTLKNLRNDQIYFNRVNRVNDPYEGIFKFNVKKNLQEKFIDLFYEDSVDRQQLIEYGYENLIESIAFENVNTFLDEVGLSCFSRTNKSIVMWGNYADKHNGICIEYDKTKPLFNLAQKVIYRNRVFTVSVDEESKVSKEFLEKEFLKVIANKFVEWKYEKEYRIFLKANCTVTYNTDSIKAIYFGVGCNERRMNEVFEATKHLDHLIFFKADLEPHKYEMKFRKLTLKGRY